MKGPTVNTEFLNALPSLSLDGRIFGGSCEPNVSPVKAGGSLDLRPFASGTIKPRHPQRVPDAPLRNALGIWNQLGPILRTTSRRLSVRWLNLLRNLEAPPGFEPGMEVLQIKQDWLCG